MDQTCINFEMQPCSIIFSPMAQLHQDPGNESDDAYDDESEDPGSDSEDSSDGSDPEVTNEIMGKDIPEPEAMSCDGERVPCKMPPSPGSTPILALVPAAHASEEASLGVDLGQSRYSICGVHVENICNMMHMCNLILCGVHVEYPRG